MFKIPTFFVLYYLTWAYVYIIFWTSLKLYTALKTNITPKVDKIYEVQMYKGIIALAIDNARTDSRCLVLKGRGDPIYLDRIIKGWTEGEEILNDYQWALAKMVQNGKSPYLMYNAISDKIFWAPASNLSLQDKSLSPVILEKMSKYTDRFLLKPLWVPKVFIPENIQDCIRLDLVERDSAIQNLEVWTVEKLSN